MRGKCSRGPLPLAKEPMRGQPGSPLWLRILKTKCIRVEMSMKMACSTHVQRRETEASAQAGTYTPKEPGCPSAGGSINRHIQRWNLRRSELSCREKTWRKLRRRSLSGIKQPPPEKATYYMIPTIRHSGKGKTVETVNR